MADPLKKVRLLEDISGLDIFRFRGILLKGAFFSSHTHNASRYLAFAIDTLFKIRALFNISGFSYFFLTLRVTQS